MTAYLVLLAAVGLQRLTEIRLSRRHARWALARGGWEAGQGHFPVMAVLHASFLVACATEVLVLRRPFRPAIACPMLALVVLAQAVRCWSQRALGRYWNARVIVVPGMPRATTGPYRLLRHPNYLAVVVEMVAIPLVHGAWLTAIAYSLANAVLLRTRIRCETQALDAACGGVNAPHVL